MNPHTNEDYLKRIIYYFLTLRRGPVKETQVFTGLKHNEDLCPKLNGQLEVILGYFKRYRKIAYDIQGLRDQGSDVIVRYYPEDQSPARFVSFQIKSHHDLMERNWLRTLKSQYVESMNTYSPVDYYILVATDEGRNRDKIRMIKAEFSAISEVTVVDPSQFLVFLNFTSAEIGGLLKSYIGEGDILVNEAVGVIEGLADPQLYLITYVVDQYIRCDFQKVEIQSLLESVEIRDEYQKYSARFASFYKQFDEREDEWPDEFSAQYSGSFTENLYQDLDWLSEGYLAIDDLIKTVQINVKELKPLIALVLEAHLRYEYDTFETIEYVRTLMYSDSID